MHDRKSLQEHSADNVEQSKDSAKELARAGNFGIVGVFCAAGLILSAAIAHSIAHLDQVASLAGQVLWG